MDDVGIPHYVLPALLPQPMGVWGVSYDLFTHAIVDDLPGGWHSSGGAQTRTFLYIIFEN